MLLAAPRAEAVTLARALVESSLVACVNVVPGALIGVNAWRCVFSHRLLGLLAEITSVYRWEGEILADPESLLIIKTRAENVAAVTELVRAKVSSRWIAGRETALALTTCSGSGQHSYKTPEVIFLDITGGSSDYLTWLHEVTRPA